MSVRADLMQELAALRKAIAKAQRSLRLAHKSLEAADISIGATASDLVAMQSPRPDPDWDHVEALDRIMAADRPGGGS